MITNLNSYPIYLRCVIALIALAISLLLPIEATTACYICYAVIIISLLLQIYSANVLYQKLIDQKTEIALLQTKLAKTNMVKDEFLGNMSHEFRTPLHAITGFADLLMETNIGATQLEMLKIVQISSKKLLRLIDDMLDLAQMGKNACSLLSCATAMHVL